MKQIMLSIVIVLTGIVSIAQMDVHRQSANYEAANWKTWLLDDPRQITVTAPPATAQSKAELQLSNREWQSLMKKNWLK